MVTAVNDVIEARTRRRRGEKASVYPRPPDSDLYLRRDARASTPGQVTSAVVPPRRLRREAKREHRRLWRETSSGTAWSPEAAARWQVIQAKLDDADLRALTLGLPFIDQHGQWQLRDPFQPESLFEEALRIVLTEAGYSRRDIARITDPGEENEEHTRKRARASTPDWSPPWMLDLGSRPGTGTGGRWQHGGYRSTGGGRGSGSQRGWRGAGTNW